MALGLSCAVLLLGGCGGGDGGDGDRADTPLRQTGSSWVPGQASLAASPAFRAIAGRASALAELRQQARELLLERIQRLREAARKRGDEEARRKFEAERRRLLAKYRAALRRAARLRELQRRRLAALRRKRERELAALRRKLRVKPGEECKFAEVRRRFDCRAGQLPLGRPKRRR